MDEGGSRRRQSGVASASPARGHPQAGDRGIGLLPALLAIGAEAYGFRSEVWTCVRIARVIEWEFGVSYHKDHVSRLLKAIEWTPQKPIGHATQRNELEIANWRTKVWPELKKSAA